MHSNFLINLGSATAADIETLGETVRQRVKESSGVDLEWEIKRIGVSDGSVGASDQISFVPPRIEAMRRFPALRKCEFTLRPCHQRSAQH